MNYCNNKPYNIERLEYDYNSNKFKFSTLENEVNAIEKNGGLFMFIAIPKDIDLDMYKKEFDKKINEIRAKLFAEKMYNHNLQPGRNIDYMND